MNCPNCHEPAEPGAAFCGNCGQALQAQIAQPAAAGPGIPGYALEAPARQQGETRALLSLLFGILGIAGSLFMALIGLSFGVAGLVMGSTSRRSAKRGLSTAGLLLSALSVLVGLAVWTYAIQHLSPDKQTRNTGNGSTVAASELSTPCYSFNFIDRLNVSHAAGSCNMNAYNGPSLDTSTNAYKVYANQSQVASADDFVARLKTAIEKDISQSLPGFSLDSEQATTFAGSPAYVANASDKSHKVAIVEAAVWHKVPTGDNIFILVHANSGNSADLQIMESQWVWK